MLLAKSCGITWSTRNYGRIGVPIPGMSRFRAYHKYCKRIRDLPGSVPTSLKRLELSREFWPIEGTAWSLNALLRTVWAGAVSGGPGPSMALWFLHTIIGTLSRWDRK